MLTSAVGFAIMNACAKEASPRLSFLQISFFRSAIGAIALFLFARWRGTPLVIHNRKILALRALTGTVAIFFHFYSITHFPFSEVTALLNLTPMFVAILAAVWLKERVSFLLGSCLVIALGGVLLIARPDGSSAMGAASLIALGAPAMSAIAMVSLRRLGSSENAESVVVYFFSIAATILGVLAAPTMLWPTFREAVLLLFTGLSAAIAQLTMTRAYAADRAARVGGLNYLNIVASVIVGWIAFRQFPDALSLAGMTIIVLAGAGLLWTARQEASS
ncbi:MAG: DMT family transporter [Polyangiaceae bacterium]